MAERTQEDATLIRRMTLMYLFMFGASGINQPYMPVWLGWRGLSDPEIALAVGVPFLLRVVISPFLGRYADAVADRRRLIVLLGLMTAAFAFALWASHGFWPIFIFYVLMLVPIQNIAPIVDASAVDQVRRGVIASFGRLRLWGSAGYAMMNIVGGYALAFGGPATPIYMFGLAVALSLAATLALPPIAAGPPKPGRTERSVFRRPAAAAMVIAGALVLGSQAVWNSFGSIHLRELGVPDRYIGYYWAIATCSELMIFWAGPYVSRWFSPVGVLMLAASAGALRWLLMSLDPGPISTGFIQVMHSAMFGCTHLGIAGFFAAAVSSSKGASAQTDFVTASSLTLGLFTVASGPLYRSLGGDAYLVAALLPVCACVLLLAFRRAILREMTDDGAAAETGRET